LENRILDNDSLEEQERLLQILPRALKQEVEALKNKSITSQVHFFSGTSKEFNRQVMQYLTAYKVYKQDSLFSQGDSADEIYFVQQGSFTLLIDISDYLNAEELGIDPKTESFNVPFNSYASGSYFGDEDSFGELPPSHG
jgi:CRP-like cAMP-binding protein